ncbi:MAG: hypothetical protein AAF721_18535 [Myxococcota bacterium]
MSLRTLLTAAAFVLAAGAAPAANAAPTTWSDWFSEDTNPYWARCTGNDRAVSGVRCSGSYCDNVGIRCQDMPWWIRTVNRRWTQWFSEEGSDIATDYPTNPGAWYTTDLTESQHVCNAGGSGGIVTGMACGGRYCDFILLECATPMMDVAGVLQPAELVNCEWSDYYSEEDPWFAYGATSNHWITGVECDGRYCDNKSYHVCELRPPANSCVSHCGGTSADLTCYCDSLCTSWGDCCADYQDAC